MPERLSFDRTVELLREVVAAWGANYVYTYPSDVGCFYVRDGRPSCLVARVVDRAGLPIKPLEAIDLGGVGTTVVANEELFEQWFTPGAVRLLGRCQYYQDRGVAWGEALRTALREIGEQE